MWSKLALILRVRQHSHLDNDLFVVTVPGVLTGTGVVMVCTAGSRQQRPTHIQMGSLERNRWKNTKDYMGWRLLQQLLAVQRLSPFRKLYAKRNLCRGCLSDFRTPQISRYLLFSFLRKCAFAS